MNPTLPIIDDLVKGAQATGTFSMQVLLTFFILALGVGIVWMHKDNRKMMASIILDAKHERDAMTAERLARIAALMSLLAEDTKMKEQVKNALDNNTQAIEDLRELIRVKT